MANTKKGIHFSILGYLTSTRYGGLLFASKHHDSASKDELIAFSEAGDVILGRTPPLEIKKLFKAGYLHVVQSIDNAVYYYSKDGM